MTRWLVEFGYDGSPFAGWARQPGHRTVESELRAGLVRCGIAPLAAARLEVASRTDRGVSARANVLAVTSEFSGGTLLKALNGIAPEMFFRRAREVPEGFRVRAARWREYRYGLGRPSVDAARWRELLGLFLGRPFDARSFARALPAGAPCWWDLMALELAGRESRRYVRVRAHSFLWGMVRKIVGAVGTVAEGRVPEDALRSALAGRSTFPAPLAPAEPLVLWKVDVPGPWTHTWLGATRGQQSYFTAETDRAARRSAVLEGLFDPPPPRPGVRTLRRG